MLICIIYAIQAYDFSIVYNTESIDASRSSLKKNYHFSKLIRKSAIKHKDII